MSKVKTSDLIKEELEALAEANNGVLKPRDVVDFARNPDTALHSRFEWDYSKAAEAYRLWQARQVIKITLTVIEREDKDEIIVPTFVSMSDDRRNGGGYRLLVDVMSDDEQRQNLLRQAHRDFKSWQAKYQQLKELEPVFKQMDEVMGVLV